jgi:hypothetical protein
MVLDEPCFFEATPVQYIEQRKAKTRWDLVRSKKKSATNHNLPNEHTAEEVETKRRWARDSELLKKQTGGEGEGDQRVRRRRTTNRRREREREREPRGT